MPQFCASPEPAGTVPWRRLMRIMTSPCAYAAETSFGRLPPNLKGPLATYHSRWSAHVAQVSGRPVDWGNSLTDVDEAGVRVQLRGPARAWRGDDELELGGPQRRTRLEELRHATTADRIDILLRLGGHHEVLAELAALTRRHPLRERSWGQLMLALDRPGRAPGYPRYPPLDAVTPLRQLTGPAISRN
jgi:hypothetical protein